MKKTVLLLFALFGPLFASERITELINDILKLKGTEKSVIERVKDPFEKQVVVREGNFTPPPEPVFELKAIFEGTALINNKWRKVGEMIDGYEIFEIKKNSVILFDKTKQKKLYLFEGKK